MKILEVRKWNDSGYKFMAKCRIFSKTIYVSGHALDKNPYENIDNNFIINRIREGC